MNGSTVIGYRVDPGTRAALDGLGTELERIAEFQTRAPDWWRVAKCVGGVSALEPCLKG
ncbi:hypothetical protein [Barrientosiimonas endolithica]|uniref:Uncharacterized protein n=1 Tax=Barrientosiimonas endolithica TaxID=1535208 RepID=A0ABN6YS40_9MICO|nr:hypothetical protein [Barrientosiimonas endolithica]BDZ59771.1 hypothetical protein GCM10025872_34280 [Barrientosiimonas endolithica]